jgi:hypothetical protein
VRRVIRVVVLVAAVGCLVCFFSFGSESGASGSRMSNRLYVGQPWPWFENWAVQERLANGAVSSQGESGLVLDSPAWLLLAGGIGAVVVWRRLRPRSPAASPA